jgi:DNA-binding NarL/FixJ family response regulator
MRRKRALSSRQAEIGRLLCRRNLKIREIAQELGITVSNVCKQLIRMYDKTGMDGKEDLREHLIAYPYKLYP